MYIKRKLVAFATYLPPRYHISRDSMGAKLLNFLKNVQFQGLMGAHGVLKEMGIYGPILLKLFAC